MYFTPWLCFSNFIWRICKVGGPRFWRLRRCIIQYDSVRMQGILRGLIEAKETDPANVSTVALLQVCRECRAFEMTPMLSPEVNTNLKIPWTGTARYGNEGYSCQGQRNSYSQGSTSSTLKRLGESHIDCMICFAPLASFLCVTDSEHAIHMSELWTGNRHFPPRIAIYSLHIFDKICLFTSQISKKSCW